LKDTELEIFAGRLDSIKTHLPFDYYYLNFCEPDKIEYTSKGVGDSITGDNLANTPYKVIFSHNIYSILGKNDVKQFMWITMQEKDELHIIWEFQVDDRKRLSLYIIHRWSSKCICYQ